MFGKAYSRYVLAVMTAVYMVNLMDRMLVVILLQSIKVDMSLSDTQLGFITGIAFALFYATLGLPIARWADRGNRVTITSLAIGLWGITVAACLVVTSYAQLVSARIAASVGEAGCKPPTYSLVGDYFPGAAERTRAMAIYWLGGPAAALTSFIVGGWLNELYGWRMTFFLVSIPGFLLAVLVKITIVEPRTRAGHPSAVEHPLPPMKAVLSTLWLQRSCRHLSIALILLYTMSYGLAPWYAAFMVRNHGMGTAELGLWLGLIVGVSGATGILSGGYLAAGWFASNEKAQMRMTAGAMTLLVPCFVAFLLLPQKYHALIALMPLMVVFHFFLAPTYSLMQRLVPDEMRATTMSVVMLLANLIGMGMGPQIVGIMSDALEPVAGNDSLRYAMLIMSFVALWSGYHFWMVGRTVKQDLSGVGQWQAP